MSLFNNFITTETPFIFGGAALSADGGGYGFGCPEDGLLEFVFDRGIRVFDTAPIYGFGKSEEVLGEFIRNKREEVCIISKSGIDWHENRRVNMSNDPATTQKMIIESLRRMKTEYIDHYMIHWPDAEVDIRFPLEVLAKAQLEGKIKSIGLCNTNTEDLLKAREVVSLSSIQMQNNLFERPSSEVTALISESDCSFVGWGVFDKGILTGRVDKKRELSKNYSDGDARRKSVWWVQSDVLAKVEKAARLKDLLSSFDLTLSQAAISYALNPVWADYVLMGSKTQEDWANVLDSVPKLLNPELIKEMEAICHG